jgi:hypothetical protein
LVIAASYPEKRDWQIAKAHSAHAIGPKREDVQSGEPRLNFVGA